MASRFAARPSSGAMLFIRWNARGLRSVHAVAHPRGREGWHSARRFGLGRCGKRLLRAIGTGQGTAALGRHVAIVDALSVRGFVGKALLERLRLLGNSYWRPLRPGASSEPIRSALREVPPRGSNRDFGVGPVVLAPRRYPVKIDVRSRRARENRRRILRPACPPGSVIRSHNRTRQVIAKRR